MDQGDFNMKVLLAVGGMTCQMCVGHVQDALAAVAGVVAVSVALDPPQALVTLAPDALTQPEDLIDAVHEAGYDAAVAV